MGTALEKVADGVLVGALTPMAMINTVLIEGAEGDVVVDSGLFWSGRRLARFLRGREVVEHAVTHAHGDHVGSSAWLCRHTGAPLAMGDADANRFESGAIDTHASVVARAVLPRMARERRPVDRRLVEGDTLAGFEVLEVPGHSPGTLAFWREADRVLIVGDGPINISKDPRSPRWLPLPSNLHHSPNQASASRHRLAGLRPSLVVATHGYPVAAPDRWAEGAGGSAT
jgi:hydroxyacylglutathione hydrolase